MTDDLRECPFCGKTNKLKLKPYRADDDGGEPFDFGFMVQCDATGFDHNPNRGCGAQGAWGETEEDAINEWNIRTLPEHSPATLNETPSEILELVQTYRTTKDGEFWRGWDAGISDVEEEIKRLLKQQPA